MRKKTDLNMSTLGLSNNQPGGRQVPLALKRRKEAAMTALSKARADVTSHRIMELRSGAGITQSEFWGRFGVTQSGASRYEQGRARPLPLRILMVLRLQGKITDADLEAARKIATSTV